MALAPGLSHEASMQPDSSGLNSILCQLFTLQDESHQLLLGLTFSENFDVKKITNVGRCQLLITLCESAKSHGSFL